MVISKAVVTSAAAADAVVAGGVPDVFMDILFFLEPLAFIILLCVLVLFPQFRGWSAVFMCVWIVRPDHA